MSEKLANLGREWRFWGLALLFAVIHFLVATGCGIWGIELTKQQASRGNGEILIMISQVLFFPLFQLMDIESFRKFVEASLPGSWGHVLAFALSYCWGVLLAAIAWRIWEKRARKPLGPSFPEQVE